MHLIKIYMGSFSLCGIFAPKWSRMPLLYHVYVHILYMFCFLYVTLLFSALFSSMSCWCISKRQHVGDQIDHYVGVSYLCSILFSDFFFRSLQRSSRQALTGWMLVWRRTYQLMWNGYCAGACAVAVLWVAVCGRSYASTRGWDPPLILLVFL